MLQSCTEVTGFFDEDLVEIWVEIFDLVEEISVEDMGEILVWFFVEAFEGVMKSFVAFGDNVIEIL